MENIWIHVMFGEKKKLLKLNETKQNKTPKPLFRFLASALDVAHTRLLRLQLHRRVLGSLIGGRY